MKPFVFVADLFANQYTGGAELTTEAIIQGISSNTIKINSENLAEQQIETFKDSHWIICNFSALTEKNKLLIAKNLDYSIVEYDYKFCKYRSLEKHFAVENKPCDCLTYEESKIYLIFYGYAKKIWFMSKVQQQIFLDNVKTIKQESCEVLSSVFSKGDLRFIESIKDNEKDDVYLILDSNSWIKGTKKCIEYAESNNLKFQLIKDLPYHELLIKMSLSKGLIFRPLGGDTCPRICIEAKLLGCDLHLNENVQHKNEEWFSKTYQECSEYLLDRTKVFWDYYEK